MSDIRTEMTSRVDEINRRIMRINADTHEIGPTNAQRDEVSRLVEEREVLRATERREARRARRKASH